jgi:hypothetical protein
MPESTMVFFAVLDEPDDAAFIRLFAGAGGVKAALATTKLGKNTIHFQRATPGRITKKIL